MKIKIDKNKCYQIEDLMMENCINHVESEFES
jgi:hypothetical protein